MSVDGGEGGVLPLPVTTKRLCVTAAVKFTIKFILASLRFSGLSTFHPDGAGRDTSPVQGWEHAWRWGGPAAGDRRGSVTNGRHIIVTVTGSGQPPVRRPESKAQKKGRGHKRRTG